MGHSLSLPLRLECDQQKWVPVFASDRVPNFEERTIWSPNRPSLPDHARGTDSIFIGFQRGRIDIPQPGQAALVADAGAGLGQMWEEVPETEEAASCAVAPGQGTS